MSSLHFLPSSAFDIRTPNPARAAASSRHHGPAGQRKPPSPRPRRALSLGLRGCGRALQGRVRSGIGCGRGGRKRFPGDGRAGGVGGACHGGAALAAGTRGTCGAGPGPFSEAERRWRGPDARVPREGRTDKGRSSRGEDGWAVRAPLGRGR